MPRDPTPLSTSILSIDNIVDSPFNPRIAYDEQDLQELAQSIRVDGVLEPVMVRERHAKFELVFGHRRVRAARLAGLTQVPAIVRDVDDATAARMQLVENLERKDLNPLEQADGLVQLHKVHGLTIEQMVEQTGLSRSAVYERLKLATLEPDGRKALLAGKLTPATATLVARVPPGKHQAVALEKALERGYRSEPKSFRDVRAELLELFATSLADAPFDVEDATLLEGIAENPIACTVCPRRSGAAPDLFNDIVAGDRNGLRYAHVKLGENVCTDPTCFAAKKKAHLAREAEALKAKGKTVITGAAARKAISAPSSYYGSQGKQVVKGDYVALADIRDAIKKAAKKGKDVQTVVIQDPRTGRKVQAVRKEDLKAAGVKLESGTKPSSNGRYGDGAYQRERQKQEARAAELTKERETLFASVREKLRHDDAFVWRIAVRAGVEQYGQEQATRRVMEARGCTTVKAWGGWIDAASADDLQRAVLEYALVRDVDVEVYDINSKESGADLRNVAAHYGIDAKAPKPAVAEEKSVGQQQAEAIEKAWSPGKRKKNSRPAVQTSEQQAEAPASVDELKQRAWPFPAQPGSLVDQIESARTSKEVTS